MATEHTKAGVQYNGGFSKSCDNFLFDELNELLRNVRFQAAKFRECRGLRRQNLDMIFQRGNGRGVIQDNAVTVFHAEFPHRVCPRILGFESKADDPSMTLQTTQLRKDVGRFDQFKNNRTAGLRDFPVNSFTRLIVTHSRRCDDSISGRKQFQAGQSQFVGGFNLSNADARRNWQIDRAGDQNHFMTGRNRSFGD